MITRRDALERRRAEEALQASEWRYRRYVERNAAGFIRNRPAGAILDCNDSMARMLGYDSAKELLGRSMPDLYFDVGDRPPLHKRLRESKVLIGQEICLKRKDGSALWALVNVSLIEGEDSGGELLEGTFLDITARKRAEEAVRRAGAYNRSLIEASLDPLVAVAPDGKITDVNEAAVKMTGVPRQELIGTDFCDYFTDPEKARAGYEQVFKEGWVQHHELEVRHRDGHTTPVHYNASVYRDEAGQVAGVIAAAVDVTEHRRAQEAIRRVGAYNRSLIEASLDPLVTIAPDGRITDVNEATVKITGVPRQELSGTDFSDYFTDPAKARAGYQRVFKEGWVQDYELEVRHREGHTTPVLYNASVYRDERGEVVGVFAAARDITERKRAEAQVYDSKQMLEFVLDNIPQRVFWKDRNFRFLGCNRPLLKDAGLESLADFIGKDDFELPWKAVAPLYRKDDQQVMETGLPKLNYEEPQTSLDGRPLCLRTSKLPLRDQQGRVIGVLGTYEDITERKQAEEKIRELNASLERRVAERTAELAAANQELEAFTYSVAHDLRGPLRGMDGFSLALLEDYGSRLDEQGQSYAQRIRAAASRMAELIDDLLNLSRISRSEVHKERVDLSALAQAVASDLQKSDPERSVEFVISPGLEVEADPRLLRVALDNLLGNAWKFTAQRRPARIELGLDGRNGQKTYFVRDNGAGFDMAYVGKLFAPFQRLHSPTEFPGTGIGLATVRRVLGKHGGEISAEGAVGQGATFYFTLGQSVEESKVEGQSKVES